MDSGTVAGVLPLVRKPYYSRYGVELYLGNCAEFEFKYDLLVTDPPYGDGYKGGRTDKWALITGDDDLENIHDCLRHCLKGLRRGRHVYIFGGSLDLTKLPLCAAAELIWDKVNFGLGDLSMPWGPQHEKITFAVYEISKVNREKGFGNLTARLRKGSILRSLRAHSGRVRSHPTEKPVDILRQMIESSSVMGETVYDPFAGSGSTLIAAALECRKAIGVEIEEKYCEVAATRLDAELSGKNL